VVDTDYILITVGTFENAAEAGRWLSAFDPQANIRGAENAVISLYIISRDNLEKLTSDKNISRYRIFYETAYRQKMN
jgi:hypothetical protein